MHRFLPTNPFFASFSVKLLSKMDRIFFFTTFIFLLLPLTISTLSWSKVDEESQARIISQVFHEVGVFDRLFGNLLTRKAEQLWADALEEVLPPTSSDLSSVDDETSKYLETLSGWARNRFYDLLDCPNNEHNNRLFLDRKYYDSCQYLRTLIKRFYSEDENSDEDSTEDSGYLKKAMSELAILYQKMPAVEYKWRYYKGEDALDDLLAKEEDPNKLKILWKSRSKATTSLGVPFREIMASLASSGRGEALWNQWNADLGVVPVNRTIPLALELWAEMKEFYDLLLNFISYRTLGSTKNGSIEIQNLRSFSGTSFDGLFLEKTSNDEFLENLETRTKDEGLVQVVEEDVFIKLGFPKLPDTFWTNSYLKHSNDTTGSCHPLTFYFFKPEDVRTRMCYQKLDLSAWRKVVHELGHAHYYLAYDKTTPYNLYKSHPNAAIHEAIGDTIYLLNAGCQAKKFVGVADGQGLINRLLIEAVTSFVRLPYALSLELWRHELMTDENVSKASLAKINSRYWEIREEVSRVKAPDEDEDTFSKLDPLSKYHVAHFMPYMRYFYGTLLMHQIQASLCEGESVLANCCPKTEALDRFRKFLSLGASADDESNWNVLTGGESWRYRTEPLLKYYQPLIQWLKEFKEDSASQF